MTENPFADAMLEPPSSVNAAPELVVYAPGHKPCSRLGVLKEFIKRTAARRIIVFILTPFVLFLGVVLGMSFSENLLLILAIVGLTAIQVCFVMSLETHKTAFTTDAIIVWSLMRKKQRYSWSNVWRIKFFPRKCIKLKFDDYKELTVNDAYPELDQLISLISGKAKECGFVLEGDSESMSQSESREDPDYEYLGKKRESGSPRRSSTAALGVHKPSPPTHIPGAHRRIGIKKKPKMSIGASILSGIFTVVGILFLFLGGIVILAAIFSSSAGNEGLNASQFVFAAVLLLPGWWFLALVRKEKRRAEASVKERDSIARDKLLAFVRMRNRFTLAQMARRIERTTTETEAIICELANSGEVDLLYHRANQEYLRRGKIQTTGRVVTQCLSCGSPLKPEILMEGERVDCDYCGLRL